MNAKRRAVPPTVDEVRLHALWWFFPVRGNPRVLDLHVDDVGAVWLAADDSRFEAKDWRGEWARCVPPPTGIEQPDAHAQPLPTPSAGTAVVDLVLREPLSAEAQEVIRARDRIGVARYGTRLQPFNGRDVARDFTEEVADAVVYSRQGLEEAADDAARLMWSRRLAGAVALLEDAVGHHRHPLVTPLPVLDVAVEPMVERGRRGGDDTEVDRVARLLMAEWERVEKTSVNTSYITTFCDLARVVIADRHSRRLVPPVHVEAEVDDLRKRLVTAEGELALANRRLSKLHFLLVPLAADLGVEHSDVRRVVMAAQARLTALEEQHRAMEAECDAVKLRYAQYVEADADHHYRQQIQVWLEMLAEEFGADSPEPRVVVEAAHHYLKELRADLAKARAPDVPKKTAAARRKAGSLRCPHCGGAPDPKMTIFGQWRKCEECGRHFTVPLQAETRPATGAPATRTRGAPRRRGR